MDSEIESLRERLDKIKANPITFSTPVGIVFKTCKETQELMVDTLDFLLKKRECKHVWTSSLTGSTWCEICGIPKEEED